MRLDKAVALTGMTRTEARRAIAGGTVRVRGEIARDAGMQVQPGEVCVGGVQVEAPGPVYLMVHKPRGVVTATEDRRFQTVSDLLPPRLRARGPGPVGRLDRDVTGLVLMTTDGQLAHRLISPKWKAEKVYLARCEGALSQADIEAFAAGIVLSDFTARPALLEILSTDEEGSLAAVTLTEGKFHQVKRMFSAIGHPLLSLHRQRIGCVALDDALAPGEYRPLNDEEIRGLLKLCELDVK